MGFGFKLEYKIGNRKVSQREWERHLFHDAPSQAAKDAINKKLRSVRCPTHGESPRATFRETSRGFEINLTGCCDELIERAQRALG